MSVAADLERAFDAAALGTLAHGGAELPQVAPASLEEWTEALRLAADRRWAVLPLGLGSKLGWCRPGRCDVALSTRRWAGVDSHEPADGTVSVRSGTTVAALAERVGASGQRAALDVPSPGRSTVGGVLAAAQTGWSRLRFGPARDQVLGARALLADGTAARSGGQLVKNVTGYDLHRLWCGSHGSLAILLDVALRLYPAPAAERWLERELPSADDAFAAAARVRAASGVRPIAVAVGGDAQRWRVAVHLGGLAESVAWEEAEVRRALGPADVAADGDVRAVRDHWRDAESAGDRWPDLYVHDQPSAARETLRWVEDRARAAGLGRTVLAHPALATLAVWLDGDEAERDVFLARVTDELRRVLCARGGRAFLRAGSRALLRQVEPLGEPDGLDLMRALRERLDPERRFAAARLHGEL